MRTLRFLLLSILMFPPPATCGLSYAQNAKKLPPHYRQWIDEDVPYIITQDERREFIKLQTDDERDRFIELFWESRNPTPHSSINVFKEEHYRRLAYVRTEFGDERYNDGWRTDMGRVYITLGPPQQISKLHQGMATRPVELWFYQSPSPALPAYFNLVFYKQSEADPYILYSPKTDGPTKIVTNDEHDDRKALRTIDKSMGAEATHAMVSLIPGEPIDVDHPNPTMSSDLLLDAIRNLPEQKLEKERTLRRRTKSQEVVTSNIFSGFNRTELQTVILHDSRGFSTVHYIVRDQQPDTSLIGTLPDKRTGYDLTLLTRVMTDSGKAIYEQRDALVGVASLDSAKEAREKKFAAEGRLPLVAGNYFVESILTNNLTKVSTRSASKVSIPTRAVDVIGISGIMVYRDRPLKTQRDQLPFTLAGLRFPPRGEQAVELHAGESLSLAYQLWLPRKESVVSGSIPTAKPEVIHIHYTLGTVALTGGDPDRLDEDEELPVRDADDAGNLVSGHAIDTTHLQEGTYRLVVRATAPGSAHSAFATITVKIVPPATPVEMWSAFGDEQQHPLWQDDLLRGLAAEAVEDDREAIDCYRRVLAAKPDAVEARNRLSAITKKPLRPAPGE